jgi:hypothetical protein
MRVMSLSKAVEPERIRVRGIKINILPFDASQQVAGRFISLQ